MFVAVFLHMIIVGDKASWLKGVPRFINTDFFLNGFGIFFFSSPILNIQSPATTRNVLCWDAVGVCTAVSE